MYRLSRALLGALARAPPLRQAPGPGRLLPAALRLGSPGGLSTRPRREPPAAPQRPAAQGPGSEEEPFVFPEYVPEPPPAPAREPPAAPSRPERRPREKRQHRVTGRPDPSVPPSGVSCSGCGAELHCQDPAVPGYLPSEKYRRLMGGQPGGSEGQGALGGSEGLGGQGALGGSEGLGGQGALGGSEGLGVQGVLGGSEGLGGQGALGGSEGLGVQGVLGGSEGLGGQGALGRSEAHRALQGVVCQRCWLLVHHQQALHMQVSREQYRNLVSAALRSPPRHGRCPLVLYMVDMLDLPDSVLQDLPQLVGAGSNILVVGNKVDLLPGDSPDYLKRFRKQLLRSCARVGILPAVQGSGGQVGRTGSQNLVDVHLISAKTGYGVEKLISKLQRSWKCNGDVYLVGATNSGKSTLFNTLLQSDYCKSKAPEVINRATISPWPGTTLNLLKFPIINPTSDRLFRRQERLKADAEKTEEQLSDDEQKYLKCLKKQGYLIGRVGRTFQQQKSKTVIDFDPDELSFNMEEEPVFSSNKPKERVEFTYNELKDARWFFDTPGIVKENCVLNLLTEKEVKLVLPTHAIVPRTFVLKPGMVLFLGALGRIDYLQGAKSSWFSVVASNLLPVHVTTLEKADSIYQKHAGKTLLKVPMGGEERMKEFPPLIPQEITLEGIGTLEAVADIKLSSAGWVAITAHLEDKLQLRAYTPEGTTLMIRKPPLLPHIIDIKGNRIRGSACYRTKKPPPLVENLKANGTNKQI
ncbi:synaptotagmin-A-like [Platysternon megacephalum]|uniref:Synaptotagmin-A-like n=1 Tax=Platysternon megacephalum TaxID=55544 RepID=A0A4D9E322_9SAUR|nr:synaptotagmin-A-like [Platysternon megacephalum]